MVEGFFFSFSSSFVPSHSTIWTAHLPKALGLNETTSLVLETVQTHATYPWPKEAAQADDQLLKYETDLLIISPYNTVVQRTKIRYARIPPSAPYLN